MILFGWNSAASSVLVACGVKERPADFKPSSKFLKLAFDQLGSFQSLRRAKFDRATETTVRILLSLSSVRSLRSQQLWVFCCQKARGKRSPQLSSFRYAGHASGDFSYMAGTWKMPMESLIPLMPRDLYQILPSWAGFAGLDENGMVTNIRWHNRAFTHLLLIDFRISFIKDSFLILILTVLGKPSRITAANKVCIS